jgi:inner membrane translocase subunit Tim23
MATIMTSDSDSLRREDEESNNTNSRGTNSSLLSSLLSSVKLGPAIPTVSPATRDQLEYLFDDEYVSNGPSWGARICYGTGSTYLVGLGAGGLWGLLDGLRNPQGSGSRRLRINCILNACTARGPFLGNSLGIVALLYNGIHGAVIKARNDRDDLWGAVGAAVISGSIFKSTAGVKKSILGGGVFGSAVLAYHMYQQYQKSRF